MIICLNFKSPAGNPYFVQHLSLHTTPLLSPYDLHQSVEAVQLT
jgi:hypothetical protein